MFSWTVREFIIQQKSSVSGENELLCSYYTCRNSSLNLFFPTGEAVLCHLGHETVRGDLEEAGISL